MKIAIVTDTYFPEQVNGVAKVAYRQAAALEALGHEVRVWSVHNVPSLPFWGYKGERFALPIGRVYREIGEWEPDIIHAHTPFILGWEAVAAARTHKHPLVGTHHTFFDHYLKHVHLDTALSRALSWKYLTGHYNRYNLVLSPSQALLDGMVEHGLRAQARVFPNSVHTESFVPATLEKKRELKRALGLGEKCLVYMGRLSYEKSIDKVIEAFALARESDPEIELLVVGDGPERKPLERLAEKLGLAGAVRFTGILHDTTLVEALQAADVFVSASKSENMPLSILEAMSTGLPVIGVKALGVPEIVEDGVSGLITLPDDVSALAAAMLRLCTSRDERERFSQAARARALEYGEAEQARRLEEVYTALINS